MAEGEDLVLFQCSRCRLPLADSGNLVGSDDDLIRLTAVSHNVEVSDVRAVSSYELDDLSTVQLLYCRGCTATVGTFFLATPAHLDDRLDLFVLSRPTIICYVFDSTSKQRVKEYKESTVKLNVSYMESRLKKIREVFGCCERLVEKIEDRLLEVAETP